MNIENVEFNKDLYEINLKENDFSNKVESHLSEEDIKHLKKEGKM